jgi:hypothetical protein
VVPRLWRSCFTDACALNLGSMPVARSLSTAYKRRVCLNKICVIVEDNSRRVFVNDINLTAFQILPDPTIFDIQDPNLLNKALLSIAASSYTGVDFTTPPNNVCRDTNAPKVVGIVWSSFAVLAIVFILVLWVVCKLVLQSRGTSEESAPRLGVHFTSYVLGLLWAGIHFASIITDVILLGQVWGVWPMWFIRGFIIPQYVVTAWLLGTAHLSADMWTIRRWFRELRAPSFVFLWQLSRATARPEVSQIPSRGT